ncbi:MAG: putative small lipoprotein YifL [Paracoccaceae bacterium]|jgi:predicted small lipoprotein YifL
MRLLLIVLLTGTLTLAGCGLDGEPLTPPAKTTG